MAWPIRTAGGEVFHSTDAMLRSENQYIRGLAQAMIAARDERERMAAAILNRDLARTS